MIVKMVAESYEIDNGTIKFMSRQTCKGVDEDKFVTGKPILANLEATLNFEQSK